MRLLDRYLIRETIAPFLLALAVFTFILAVQPMLDEAGKLLAKGAPLPTVAYLLFLLLPQSLAVTIPIAFLAGLLMALGRWSGDREAVALLACGVSPLRLLRPVLLMASVVVAVDLYVLLYTVPDNNQTYREVTYRLTTQQAQSDIKPRLFYEGFPGKVIYVHEILPGRWRGVFIADTTKAHHPTVILADEGHLVMDDARREVNVILRGAHTYIPGIEENVYDIRQNDPERVRISAESVYGSGTMGPLARGLAEKTVAELQKDVVVKLEKGESPHNEIMFIHQKFAFPVAAVVFALLALPLGLHTRREGKLAGLSLGLAVVFVYYGIHALAEGGTKGQVIPAAWARWLPHLVLTPLGLLAIWWRMRSTGRELSVPVPGFLRRKAAAEPARAGSEAATPPAAGRPGRVVVVIRIPRLWLPRPRLLDLYVSNKYLRLMALSFVGLLGMYYIGTFIDLSEKMFKGQAPVSMMLQYLWHSTPQFVLLLMPMATLVAVLATVGGLTRTSELTVMRACGVSLYRVAVPMLLMGLLWSSLLFILDERVVAQANRKAAVLQDTMRGRLPRTVDSANRHWLAAPNRFYYYLGFDANKRTLRQLSVYDTTTEPFRLVRHTYVFEATANAPAPAGTDEATLVPWRASRGWTQAFASAEQTTRERFNTRPLALAASETFAGDRAEADLMTYGQLREHVRRLDESGFSVNEERLSLHRKLAMPFGTMVMTLLGVPFGMTIGRRGALAGIGLAIALAVGYWLIGTFFGYLGAAGLLAAPLAAWSANIIFAALAVVVVLTVRT